MMKDLSPAARDLVDAHRSDRTLTSADRKRIKDDVMLRVAALGATTAVAAELTTKVATNVAAKAAGVSLASKVAVVALSVTAVAGVVSVSVRALRARAPSNPTPTERSARTIRQEPEVVVPAPRPTEKSTEKSTTSSTVAAPTTAPGRGPAASRAVVAAPATVPARATTATRRVALAAPAPHLERRPAVTREVAAVPAGSTPVDSAHRDQVKTLDDPPKTTTTTTTTTTTAATVVVPPDPEPELRVLRQARDDLRGGRPASAYRRLDDFDRHASGGMLAQERSALSAIALCQWQPGAEARARAAEFLRSSPESPLAIRVRSACAQASKASP